MRLLNKEAESQTCILGLRDNLRRPSRATQFSSIFLDILRVRLGVRIRMWRSNINILGCYPPCISFRS